MFLIGNQSSTQVRPEQKAQNVERNKQQIPQIFQLEHISYNPRILRDVIFWARQKPFEDPMRSIANMRPKEKTTKILQKLMEYPV